MGLGVQAQQSNPSRTLTQERWQCGSGIRGNGHFGDTLEAPSAIAIVRLRQAKLESIDPNLDSIDPGSTGSCDLRRHEAAAGDGWGLLDLANACSTPLSHGCSKTENPEWHLECCWFTFDPEHTSLEISVWDSERLQRSLSLPPSPSTLRALEMCHDSKCAIFARGFA